LLASQSGEQGAFSDKFAMNGPLKNSILLRIHLSTDY